MQPMDKVSIDSTVRLRFGNVSPPAPFRAGRPGPANAKSSHKGSPQAEPFFYERGAAGLRVVLGVWAHVEGRGHAVRHVEEGRDRRDVPDVPVREADPAQIVPVLLLH